MKNTKKILFAALVAVVLGLFTGCTIGNPFSGKTFEGNFVEGGKLGSAKIILKFDRDVVHVSFDVGVLGVLNLKTGDFDSDYDWNDSTVTFKISKDAESGTTFYYEMKKNKLILEDSKGNEWAELTRK